MIINNPYVPEDEQPEINQSQRITEKDESHFPSPIPPPLPSENNKAFKTEHHVVKVTEQSLDQLKVEGNILENELQNLTEDVKNLEGLNLQKTVALEQLISESGGKIVKNLITVLKRPPEKIKEKIPIEDPFEIPFLEGLEALANQASTYAHFSDYLGLRAVDPISSKTFSGVELGVIFANSLSRGGILIAISSLIGEAKKFVELQKQALKEAPEADRAEIKKEIEILETWIAEQIKLVKKHALTSGVSITLALPKVGSGMLNLLNLSTTTAGMVLETLVAGISIVTSALEWRNAAKQIDDHEVWRSLFTQPQVRVPIEVLESKLQENKQILERLQESLEPLRNNPEVTPIEAVNIALKHLKSENIELPELSVAQNMEELFTLLEDPQINEILVQKAIFSEKVQHLIDKQKNAFELKLEKNQQELEQLQEFLKNLNEVEKLTPKAALEIARQELKTRNMELPELTEAKSLGELSQLLAEPSINKRLVEKKEMLSFSLRQAFKTFISKKASIDNGFLKLKLNKARAIFTVTALVTAASITLKVLILVGVIAATGAMMATGYGILAVTLIASIVGLCYLYYKKPNIFKTFIQGTQAKLVFKSLASSIQDLRRRSLVLEASRVAESARVIDMRRRKLEMNSHRMKLMQKEAVSLPPIDPNNHAPAEIEIQKHLETYHQKLDSHLVQLDSEIAQLDSQLAHEDEKLLAIGKKLGKVNHSIEKLDRQIGELKKEINEAGWKDYLAFSHPQEEDPSFVFADYLLKEESLLDDPETASLLDKMRIDLPSIRMLSDKNTILKKREKDLSVNQTMDAIKSFFAMDDAEMMTYIYKMSQKR